MRESIQIIQACEEIMDLNLVYGTWGNVSMKLSEDRILITPSGIPYDTLREEDLVLCDKNGSVLEGTLPPSSELKMHVAIYATRKHVNAIIHTHSLYASIASTIFNEVPLLTEDVAMVIGGKLKVTSYRLPGTQELADEIVRNIGDTNAVIIANHGQVSVGVTTEDAILAALMCEKASQMYVIATGTGKVPSSLSDQDIKNFYDKYVNSYKKLKEAKK
jgi:L-fuculose-phosphate aldolase